VLIGRRGLLLGAISLAAAACARPPLRPTPPAAVPLPDLDAWNQEANGILSDVLQTLRTFDSFQAFRVSTAAQSSLRLGSELAWDPPTSAAWEEATHVTRGLRGRSEQLLAAVSTASIDPTAWRDRRTLADATHNLLDLSDALTAYRDRIDNVPPGDASGALALLDKAWSQWEGAAARWSVARAEPIPCG
jgi:hypothetical protein